MSKLDTSTLKPGDVVVVGMSIPGLNWLIWLQSVLSGNWKYRKAGHVAVVHHTDTEGRLWGIEAQANGIGWVNLNKHNGSWGVANSDQPRSEEVNTKLIRGMEQLLGVPYDYLSYLEFALNTLGITDKWKDFNGNDVPVSLICSAYADFVYEEAGLPNPGGMEVTRFTTPALWYRFIDKREWENA